MKTKVKIVNVVPSKTHPIIFARLIEVDSGIEITSNSILDIFRFLELYQKERNYECVNLGEDRLGLPCVLDT